MERHIDWPSNELRFASMSDLPHDLVLLAGTEPNLRWRRFCDELIAVMKSIGVEMVVTLGALLADVPHTRPVRVTGTAADPDLAARLHLERSRYEGPTGIVGALGDALRQAGLPSASLWAAVPHYVGQTPSPKATLALIERTAALLGIPVRTRELEEAAAEYETKVTDLVQADSDIAEYVAQLEQDDEPGLELEMDGGESLADEVERFLREHGPK
jgi:predicted ATP-grasp superfamily ATP-dependent carboligase